MQLRFPWQRAASKPGAVLRRLQIHLSLNLPARRGLISGLSAAGQLAARRRDLRVLPRNGGASPRNRSLAAVRWRATKVTEQNGPARPLRDPPTAIQGLWRWEPSRPICLGPPYLWAAHRASIRSQRRQVMRAATSRSKELRVPARGTAVTEACGRPTWRHCGGAEASALRQQARVQARKWSYVSCPPRGRQFLRRRGCSRAEGLQRCQDRDRPRSGALAGRTVRPLPGVDPRNLRQARCLTPHEFICKRWTAEPARFALNPLHQMPGLNNFSTWVGPAARSGRSRPHSRG
jgi:hypothetical protein